MPPDGVWTTCRHMQSPRELQQLNNWSVNAEIRITARQSQVENDRKTNTRKWLYSVRTHWSCSGSDRTRSRRAAPGRADVQVALTALELPSLMVCRSIESSAACVAGRECTTWPYERDDLRQRGDQSVSARLTPASLVKKIPAGSRALLPEGLVLSEGSRGRGGRRRTNLSATHFGLTR